jgi:hypothetical protein
MQRRRALAGMPRVGQGLVASAARIARGGSTGGQVMGNRDKQRKEPKKPKQPKKPTPA